MNHFLNLMDQPADHLKRLLARAAELKPHRDAVHDQARIEDVVAKVRASAQAHAVAPDFVEPLWRDLIARSIAREFELFDHRHRL